MRKILALTVLPVAFGAGLAAFAASANADVNFRFGINVGPPAHYYYAPPPRHYYYAPSSCYWDSFHGRVCTW
jgi:hypothetical protein